MTEPTKLKLFKKLKQISFVTVVIFLATFLQTYWAMGDFSNRMSSSCLDCSFFEETLFSSLFFTFILTILFFITSLIKNKFLKISLQFVLLATVWLFLNYNIFLDRESSWSTYLFNEEINYTISHSFFPVMVLVSVVLFVLNYKKQK